MADRDEPKTSRRGFLAGAAGAGAALTGAPALAGNPKNLPPNVPEWTRTLGDGVAVRPYGKPSKHEAHVIRRDVQWLTASREVLGQLHAAARARRHHHAERAVLRAASWRHRRDRSRRTTG